MSGTTTMLVKTDAGLKDHPFKFLRPPPQSSAQPLGSTSSSVTPTTRCPICFRTACPLKSHKQYALSRGPVGAKTAARTRESSSGVRRSSGEVPLENTHERLHAHLIPIDATVVDSFIHFPLPKGVKAEVHQLFRDCKPTTFSFV